MFRDPALYPLKAGESNNPGAPSEILKVEIEDGDLQSVGLALGIVRRNDAEEILAIVQLDGIVLLQARGDGELFGLEEAAQIFLQHFAPHGQLHLQGEGAVAILVVHDDLRDLALAKGHDGGLDILGIKADADALVVEGVTHEGLKFAKFGLVHNGPVSLMRLDRWSARKALRPQGGGSLRSG